jgi:hypothetical protein
MRSALELSIIAVELAKPSLPRAAVLTMKAGQ